MLTVDVPNKAGCSEGERPQQELARPLGIPHSDWGREVSSTNKNKWWILENNNAIAPKGVVWCSGSLEYRVTPEMECGHLGQSLLRG